MCPVIPLVNWKGVSLPRQNSSRTLKTNKIFHLLVIEVKNLFRLIWSQLAFLSNTKKRSTSKIKCRTIIHTSLVAVVQGKLAHQIKQSKVARCKIAISNCKFIVASFKAASCDVASHKVASCKVAKLQVASCKMACCNVATKLRTGRQTQRQVGFLSCRCS